MIASEVLDAVKRVLMTRDDVDLGVLFGSTARGSATPSSDVDLAVLGRHADPIAISAALARELGRDVQVVRLEDASIPLLESVVDEGIVAYERTRGISAAWRSRTLMDLEIDRPWYARQRDAWLRRVAEPGL
jgi:predicted nucleotidyltransferase